MVFPVYGTGRLFPVYHHLEAVFDDVYSGREGDPGSGAQGKTSVRQIRVKHRPRPLSDNSPCYISSELDEYLDRQDIAHTRRAPYHPMTQGKIERYHRSLKNVVNLDHYYLPEELEREIARFVDYYNMKRYHESLENLKPADVYFGRGRKILDQRELVKRKTLQARKQYNLNNQKEAASLTLATTETLP